MFRSYKVTAWQLLRVEKMYRSREAVVMNDHWPIWLRRVLWFYSAWFRYGGLLIAILAGAMLVVTAFSAIRDGHVLVNGTPSTALDDLATAFGVPLLSIGVGLALFFLVPRARLPPKRDH